MDGSVRVDVRQYGRVPGGALCFCSLWKGTPGSRSAFGTGKRHGDQGHGVCACKRPFRAILISERRQLNLIYSQCASNLLKYIEEFKI